MNQRVETPGFMGYGRLMPAEPVRPTRMAAFADTVRQPKTFPPGRMIVDQMLVVARAALAGFLVPPLIGAGLVQVVALFTDPHAGPNVGVLAFYAGIQLAGPIGMIGAVAVSFFALACGRRGHSAASIRYELTIVGGSLGAISGCLFGTWLFSSAGWFWNLICIGGGLAAGIICGFLSLSILGAPFERLLRRWTPPA